MTIQRKHLPPLVIIIGLILIALSTGRLVAGPIEGEIPPAQVISPTSAYGSGDTSALGTAYVWGPDGEELVTIDRATNAIISRTLVGAFEDLPENHPSLHQPSAKSSTAATEVKKVYVLVYDLVLSNTQSLSAYLHWNSHAAITQGTIALFQQASHNHVQYEVAYTTVITDGWPELTNGYRYTETTYLATLNHQITPPTDAAMVDYTKIVNTPGLDLCGKLNRGDIDELWIYNGPYFGFWESTLVGPGAYWFNSPPVPGPTTCTRLMPIMGPSPERDVPEAVHNFGHRTESTLTQTYGSWQQNSTAHNWDRYALVKYLSPSYSYSGCGDIHFPPNGTSDYNYNNASTVNTNCADFDNYPNLSDPLTVLQPVTCSAWSCDHLAYLDYWFSHLPHNPGCGPDNVANDWWKYFANPALALDPSSACVIYHVFLPSIMK